MGLHGTEVAKFIVETYELPMTPEEYIEKAIVQIKLLMSSAKLLPGKKV